MAKSKKKSKQEVPTKPIREYQESDWIDVVDEGVGLSGLPDKTRRQALINALEPWMRGRPTRELGFHHVVGDDPDARRLIFLNSPLRDEPKVGKIMRGAHFYPKEKAGLDESKLRSKILDKIKEGGSPFHSSLSGGLASLGSGAFTDKPVGFYSPDEIPISLRARQEVGLPPEYSVGWTKGMETAAHEMDHSGLAALRSYLMNKAEWMKKDRDRYDNIPIHGKPEEKYVRALQATNRPILVARRPAQQEEEEAALKAHPNPFENLVQKQALEMLRKRFAGRRLYPPRRSE